MQEQEKRKISSIATIFALTKNLVGGTILTLPLLVLHSGSILSLIIIILSGIISWKTASLYITHNTSEQFDFQQSLERILGITWKNIFMIMTVILYIVLINDMLYNILYFIMQETNGQWLADKNNQITFNKFSLQYIAIIMYIPWILYLQIARMDIIVKLSGLGLIAVIFYLFFIIYQFIINIFVNHKNLKQYQLFNADLKLFEVTGTMSLAFTLQTAFIPMLKISKHQNKNHINLFISYVFAIFIYLVIGIIGSLALYNKKNCNIDNVQTILDCFKDSDKSSRIAYLIVSILYFFSLVCISPFFVNIGRNRFFLFFLKQKQISKKHKIIYNLILLLIATIISVYYINKVLEKMIKPSIIMNFIGSVICFFFVYFIPIITHLKCLYKEKLKFLFQKKQIQQIQKINLFLQKQKKCNNHQQKYNSHGFLFRKLFYSFLLFLGIIILILGMYQCIYQLVN